MRCLAWAWDRVYWQKFTLWLPGFKSVGGHKDRPFTVQNMMYACVIMHTYAIYQNVDADRIDITPQQCLFAIHKPTLPDSHIHQVHSANRGVALLGPLALAMLAYQCKEVSRMDTDNLP